MDFQKEEYEITFYDFCLTDFVEQTKLMVEEIVKRTVRSALRKIHEKEGIKECSEEEKKALDKAVTGMTKDIMKNMKSYEDLLEKYLSIPDYVILMDNKKHDVTKNPAVSEADMINAKIQSQMLEAEVTETARIIRSLEEEVAQYEKIKQSVVDAEAIMGLLENRMEVDVKTTNQKKSIKYIEDLIADKKERCN